MLIGGGMQEIHRHFRKVSRAAEGLISRLKNNRLGGLTHSVFRPAPYYAIWYIIEVNIGKGKGSRKICASNQSRAPGQNTKEWKNDFIWAEHNTTVGNCDFVRNYSWDVTSWAVDHPNYPGWIAIKTGKKDQDRSG
jgi:hypothetical protein